MNIISRSVHTLWGSTNHFKNIYSCHKSFSTSQDQMRSFPKEIEIQLLFDELFKGDRYNPDVVSIKIAEALKPLLPRKVVKKTSEYEKIYERPTTNDIHEMFIYYWTCRTNSNSGFEVHFEWDKKE